MRHGETMRYLPTTAAQRAEMLRTIGVGDLETLVERIPSKARLGRDLAVPAAMAEGDLIAHLRSLAERNADADRFVTFLGGGAYDHYIPSAVNHSAWDRFEVGGRSWSTATSQVMSCSPWASTGWPPRWWAR